MKDVTIRKATAGEVDIVVALISADPEHLLRRTREEVVELLGCIWVAVAHNEIIGCVTLEVYSAKIAELRSLIVKEPWRDHGVGKALAHTAVEEAMARGIHEVLVVTSAPAFFEKIGFGPCLKEKYALFYVGDTPCTNDKKTAS